MDAAVTVAFLATCVTLVVGVLAAGATALSAYKTAKTAREGRIEQRRADAYLRVLTIVEREGHWAEAWVATFGDLPDPHDEFAELLVKPPGPDVADRATMSALLAAYGSSEVRDRYAAWRAAADVITRGVRSTLHWLSVDPDAGPTEEYLKEMRDEQVPKEQALRRDLAEAIARELGHR
jgi:hypothetical protein